MKFVKYLSENVWVWAGTGMVLITLSGKTRSLGIWITLVAVIAHAVASTMNGDE